MRWQNMAQCVRMSSCVECRGASSSTSGKIRKFLLSTLDNSFGSVKFLNTVQKLFLIQHVDFPTRARGSDTPHTLDLVLTNSNCVNNIDTLAPLGKSDHAMMQFF